MTEIMNAFSTTVLATEAANAKLITDYQALSRIEKYAKSDYKITDSLEEAIISVALTGKRSLAIGSILSTKQLALMKIPAVLISLNKTAIDLAINLYPESSQELYDDILCSIKLTEDKKIQLPVVIHLDSLLKETREQLETLTQKTTENFLESFSIEKPEKLIKSKLADNLDSLALLNKSIENVEKIMSSISDQWKKRTKRTFQATEKYMTEGAEYLFVTYGSISINAKLAVKKLRELGEKVGLIRLHMIRPFPQISLSAKKTAIIDTKFFIGSQGMVYREARHLNQNILSIIADKPSVEELVQLFQHLKSTDKLERVWII